MFATILPASSISSSAFTTEASKAVKAPVISVLPCLAVMFCCNAFMAAYKVTKYSASFGKFVIVLIPLASNGED